MYHQTDDSRLSGTGPGDGYNFCNSNNVCECQVAADGGGLFKCCTAECTGSGCGDCASGCKSMHFHDPSIAFPFRCHYETKKPLLSSFVVTFTVVGCYEGDGGSFFCAD